MPTVNRDRKMLGSWKEIAAYLGKGVRTVQRWENDLGMPVRRPNGAAKGVVCAWTDELDLWLAMRWAQRSVTEMKGRVAKPDLSANLQVSHDLRSAHRQLLNELEQNLKSLRERCAALANATMQAKEIKKGLASSRRPGGDFIAPLKLK